MRVKQLAVLLCVLGLAGCQEKQLAEPTAGLPAVAEVNGVALTERDLAPLIANGLDRANAIDRAINRALAAKLGREHYAAETDEAERVAATEAAANVFAARRMAELIKAVTDDEIEQRYAATVKDADFNGYQLYFAFYATEDEAKTGRAAALAGQAAALKDYRPVAEDREGRALFVSRGEVPYSLGVFVAKLKEGEFTEPALVRNGYLVLQARHIKENAKPSLSAMKEVLRRAIADERLTKQLVDYRATAAIALK